MDNEALSIQEIFSRKYHHHDYTKTQHHRDLCEWMRDFYLCEWSNNKENYWIINQRKWRKILVIENWTAMKCNQNSFFKFSFVNLAI